MPSHLLGGRGFDPEGLLSTLPAIVTAMLGMFTGEFVRRSEERTSGSRKTLWMAAGAVALLALALCLDPLQPINKKLWTPAFVFAAGAYSLGMFALFYYIIDVCQWRRWSYFFKVIGVNSITIYMVQRIVRVSYTSEFFFGGLASKLSPEAAAGKRYTSRSDRPPNDGKAHPKGAPFFMPRKPGTANYRKLFIEFQ